MNKGKQVIIGILCEFEPGHDIFKNALKGQQTAQQLLDTTALSKADIFSATEEGNTIFEYRQSWDHIERLIDMIRKNGEDVEVHDFTKVICDSKSVLEHAEALGALNRLFTPHIWKGRLAEMEELWFNARPLNRRKHDFTDLRRRVAEASGLELREDQLEQAGLSATDVRLALRNGRLEQVLGKLAAHHDHLRSEDLLLMDSDGETALHIEGAWRNFDQIREQLIKHGEQLGKDVFLHKRGSKASILEKAIEFDALAHVFHPEIWNGRADEMMALYAAVPENKRGSVDINCVLVELADRKYGSKVTIDENLTRSKLVTVFNGAAADKSASFIFRPLGLKAVWQEMDSVRDMLRRNGEKITLADLQSRSGISGETCLKTAIRLGHFESVIEILEESGESLSLADLKDKPEGGKSVLDLLAERKELTALLRPTLWVGRSQELVDLWKEIPAAESRDIDFQKIHGEVNRLSLRKKFGGEMPKPGL